MPLGLIESMESDIEPEGSIVSWHASFEMTRNKEMAEVFPDKSEFLKNLNKRMVDLENAFKKNYVDVRFGGSTSIKKVLPILCPEFSYSDLSVQDGTSAMETWERMLSADPENAKALAQSLLQYCKLDTLAMLKIYKVLVAL